MNRWLAAILAGTLLAGGIAAWALFRSGQPTGAVAVDAVGDAVAPPQQTAPDPVTVNAQRMAAQENGPSAPPARRVRHGTAANATTSAADTAQAASADSASDRLTRRVEKALAGDTDQLLALARHLWECSRGMANEEQVLRRLDRMAQFNARTPGGGLPARAAGGSVDFQSFEELEAATWARFDQCRDSKAVLDQDLHEQIARLAEDGVPSARYLYAVWAPSQYTDGAVGALELLDYQTRALDYTWRNMQERDPLGLLAMAQSYLAFRPSLFTPTNPVQGQVFQLAALKCGVDNEWLSDRAVNFGQGFGRFEADNTRLPTLEEDAAALAEAFCPDEPAPE